MGIYIGENKSAKFWLFVLNDSKNRVAEDVFIFCIDGLSRFPQTIEATYPEAEIRYCIIYRIRNTTEFASPNDIKELMVALKCIYTAAIEVIALNELEIFNDKRGKKYLKIYQSWSDNWATVSAYFKYSESV